MDAAAEPATGAAVPRRRMGHMMSSEGSRPQHARRSCGGLFRRVQVTVPVAPVVRLSWVTLRSRRAARSDATAAEEPPDCSIGKRSARWRRGWESARGARGEMCRSAALHVQAQECPGGHRRGVNPRSERGQTHLMSAPMSAILGGCDFRRGDGRRSRSRGGQVGCPVRGVLATVGEKEVQRDEPARRPRPRLGSGRGVLLNVGVRRRHLLDDIVRPEARRVLPGLDQRPRRAAWRWKAGLLLRTCVSPAPATHGEAAPSPAQTR